MILFQPIFAAAGTHATRSCGRCGRRRQAYGVLVFTPSAAQVSAFETAMVYREPASDPPVCHDCMCAISNGAAYPTATEVAPCQ